MLNRLPSNVWSLGLASLLAGALWETTGPSAAFLAAAGFAGSALLVLLFARR